jgi:hypothetical protein
LLDDERDRVALSAAYETTLEAGTHDGDVRV